jgi:hypothetical protein
MHTASPSAVVFFIDYYSYRASTSHLKSKKLDYS